MIGRDLFLERQTGVLRFIWIIILSVSLTGMVYSAHRAWRAFVTNPTVIFFESDQYPVWNVPFPGVAICDANKISRSKAMEYSDFLKKYISSVDLPRQLKYLGRNIDQNIEEQTNFTALMRELYLFDADESGAYNTLKRMQELSPSCEEILVSCKWQGREENCQDLFQTKVTPEGHCCTFNYYNKEFDFNNVSRNKSAEMPKSLATSSSVGVGEAAGLEVVLAAHLDEYMYTTRLTEGFTVLIFPPDNYPDYSTGTVLQKFVGLKRAVTLELEAATTYSVPEARKFSISQRGCRFKNEVSRNKSTSSYSYSNCLVLCKIEKIVQVCKCVPYFMPWAGGLAPHCTLLDVPCLHKYRYLFRFIYPSEDMVESSEESEDEAWNSLHCPGCVADCEGTQYDAHSAVLPLDDSSETIFDWNSTNVRVSSLRVFFGNVNSELYRMDVLYSRCELVSRIGCICCLFLGFSMVSIVEIMYFIIIGFLTILQRKAPPFVDRQLIQH